MRLGAALLALLWSLPMAAFPGLRLEGGPFLPYRINHAVASDEEGILGVVEVAGQRWDGSRVELFRTPLATRSTVVDLRFYLDEDIRGLELRVTGSGGERRVLLDLAAAEGWNGGAAEEESRLRARMRGLDPPIQFAPDGDSPGRFSLMGTDVVMAGFQAASALFGLPKSRTPLWLLGGFAAVSLALMVLPFRKARRRAAGLVCVSLGASAVLLLVASPRPTLFRVAFPGDEPGARVSGVLERRIEELPGCTLVAYAAGQEGRGTLAPAGRMELVGLWAPAKRGIPLDEVVPEAALVRFSAPPLLTVDGAEAWLGSRDFITGWVVHAHR